MPRLSLDVVQHVKVCHHDGPGLGCGWDVEVGNDQGSADRGGLGHVACLVAAEVGLGVEALGAEGAVEGPLARVAAHVALEIALLVEAHGAQVALVWLLPRVALHVARQVHLLAEALAAHRAAERPLGAPAHHTGLAPRPLPVHPVSVLIHMPSFMEEHDVSRRGREIAVAAQPGRL